MHALKQPAAEDAAQAAPSSVVPHPATLRPPAQPKASPPPSAALRQWRAAQLKSRLLSVSLWLISLSALFAVWYFGTKYRVDFYIRFNNIPAPAEVFAKLLEVNRSEKFITNVGISVRRILSGFGIAMMIAIPLGLLIGRYRAARDLLMPIAEVLRPIPAIAWVPMSIMLWPTNEVSIVYITFLGSFFPILLNTVHGVTGFDPVLIRAARCLGAGEGRLFWNVILPGALPHIFTGLAVGMGVAWVSLIAAEMISGQFGVGYFTWEAYSLVNYAEIALGMITIGVLGLACSGAIQMVGTLLMPWSSYAAAGRKDA
ncbi:MAG: ABC transporter permease [Betaproteobacteria bacterium]|jgi:NitT/TauT family transport system permease protein